MRLRLFLSSTSPCVDGGIVTSDESHTSDPTQMIDFSNIQAERQQASSNHHHIKSNTVPSYDVGSQLFTIHRLLRTAHNLFFVCG